MGGGGGGGRNSEQGVTARQYGNCIYHSCNRLANRLAQNEVYLCLYYIPPRLECKAGRVRTHLTVWGQGMSMIAKCG